MHHTQVPIARLNTLNEKTRLQTIQCATESLKAAACRTRAEAKFGVGVGFVLSAPVASTDSRWLYSDFERAVRGGRVAAFSPSSPSALAARSFICLSGGQGDVTARRAGQDATSHVPMYVPIVYVRQERRARACPLRLWARPDVQMLCTARHRARNQSQRYRYRHKMLDERSEARRRTVITPRPTYRSHADRTMISRRPGLSLPVLVVCRTYSTAAVQARGWLVGCVTYLDQMRRPEYVAFLRQVITRVIAQAKS